MNIQNDLSYYIDATNEFMGGGGLSGGATNSNITIGTGSNATLDKYLYTSNNNLYLTNPNTNGNIYFKTNGSSATTSGFSDYVAKINSTDGKLYLYHKYDLLNPLWTSGYYDIMNEVIGLKSSDVATGLELATLTGFVEGQVATIEDALAGLATTDIELAADIVKEVKRLDERIDPIEAIITDTQLREDLEISQDANASMEFAGQAINRINNKVQYNISTALQWGLGVAGVSAFGYLIGSINNIGLSNTIQYSSNPPLYDANPQLRRNLKWMNDSNQAYNISNYLISSSNSSISQGFINSNVITPQFIPQLKSNKVMLGNITTPNSAYQMEMTGDLNLNQLYINSVSLSSLLAQKQDNISTTAPIYLTTGNIGINYDSSLTKIGNNLSVVKTATQPLVWTGNDISLNYDSTLTKVGNNLSVASATASKWTTSGNNIYNNNTANVGIGSLLPQEKLDVNGNAFINGITTIGIPKINPAITTSGGTGGASLILVPNSDPQEYYQEFTSGGGTIVLSEPCSADILCVGAGGNGGTGASSGGGGAGEVIYYPNFPLRAGTLNIQVGASSTNPTNRISRIYPSSGNEIMRAKGGGDGGSFTSFTSSGSATVNENTIAIFNYTTTINISPATYTITFSDGSITLTGLTADKSYPLLKDGSGNTINPMAWYKFDNAGLTIDSSGNGYTLTSATMPSANTTDFIKGDASVSFSGSSYLQYNTGTNFNPENFSFACWAKLTNTGMTTYQTLASVRGVNTDYFYKGWTIYIRNDNGNIVLWTYSAAGLHETVLISSYFTNNNNIWKHFAFSITRTSGSNATFKFYFNGTLTVNTTVTYNSGSVNNFRIGAGANETVPTFFLLNGSRVDDFRFYSGIEFTQTQVNELYNGRVNIYTNPAAGGSGGGGALSQTAAIAGTKFDDYKAYALAGLNGSSTTGGNGGTGNTTYGTRFTTTIKGTSLSVGLGGSGVNGTPTPATKTNYGDGGDGNGGVGYGGLVIVRFKANTNYLQVKAIKNNGNSGLIINANETISGTTTPYQLKIYPFQDTYTTTGITTRGYTFQTSDGITNTQLLNLFSFFGGRIGIKNINPSAVLDVNGDITCKTFNVIGTEQYGIVCQVVNQHETGEASINVFAGTGVNYGGLSLVYQPSQNLGYISCSKNLKIKTANDAANSYIYINDSTGNIGIGKADPVSKLDINGTTTTNYLTASIIYAGEVQANIINSLYGNIVNNNNLFSSNIYIYNQIDMQNKPIYNCSYLYGGASYANEWKATTNIYHRDDQGRDRIYFKNDTGGSPPNHFTLFKSGGTTHSFADKDDVQYCLLDRFGLTTYFEVISGGGYDNVGVLDGVSTGTYVFRKMYLRLSTFTEVHRCFIEDELYTNYDDFINEFVGRVVVSKGKIKTALKEADKEWQILEEKDGITIDDSHPIVELSRKKKDKAVVGVITKRNQNADMPGRLVINSLGETGIWVVNTGGNLESGDLITTSNELGYGERQDCDFIKNYTIGKVMIDCSFDLDSPNYKCEVIDAERDLRRAFLPIFIYSG